MLLVLFLQNSKRNQGVINVLLSYPLVSKPNKKKKDREPKFYDSLSWNE